MTYARPILTDPEPRLHKKCRRVAKKQIKDILFQQVLDDMVETLRIKNGVGLSGCQIGFMWRVFVMADTIESWCFINPTVLVGGEKKWMEEACLSRPGFICEMLRYEQVIIRGWDRFGRHREAHVTGLAAQCAQHERDHLEGLLIGQLANNSRNHERRTESGARIYLAR